LKWLSNTQAKSQQDTNDASINLGIKFPVEGIPIGVDFGGSSNKGSSSSWSSELVEYLQENSVAHNKFEQEFRKANTDIIGAWRDCVLNRKGLIGWAEQTDNPREILFKMEVRPLATPFPDEFKITEVITSEHVEPTETLKEKKFGLEFSTIFKRIGHNALDAVNFIIRTDDLNYSCDYSLKALLVPNISIRAKDFVRSEGVEVGVLEYGDDVIHNAPDYNVGKDNIVEYEFISMLGGLYDLQVEYAAKESRPVSIYINEQLEINNGLADVTGGFTVEYQRWLSQGTVQLESGMNTLKLHQPNSIAHIRNIKFIPKKG
jgi:hypothetical protein